MSNLISKEVSYFGPAACLGTKSASSLQFVFDKTGLCFVAPDDPESCVKIMSHNEKYLISFVSVRSSKNECYFIADVSVDSMVSGYCPR